MCIRDRDRTPQQPAGGILAAVDEIEIGQAGAGLAQDLDGVRKGLLGVGASALRRGHHKGSERPDGAAHGGEHARDCLLYTSSCL